MEAAVVFAAFVSAPDFGAFPEPAPVVLTISPAVYSPPPVVRYLTPAPVAGTVCVGGQCGVPQYARPTLFRR